MLGSLRAMTKNVAAAYCMSFNRNGCNLLSDESKLEL